MGAQAVPVGIGLVIELALGLAVFSRGRRSMKSNFFWALRAVAS
jgi:hypothetical protein